LSSHTYAGVREAVLVAKHGCGFVTWPSAAKLPDGSKYNYSVASSAWQGGKGDVVSSFKASCLKKGLGVGYYYSLGSNKYTTGLNLSATELEAVEMQQMTELWTTYGNNGNLTEVRMRAC
jgi:alpha-L-fucosidase